VPYGSTSVTLQARATVGEFTPSVVLFAATVLLRGRPCNRPDLSDGDLRVSFLTGAVRDPSYARREFVDPIRSELLAWARSGRLVARCGF
jgi:hypothetical protein